MTPAEEGQSVFFRLVATRKLPILQWMVLHSYSFMAALTGFSGLFFFKDIKLGREGRWGKSRKSQKWGIYDRSNQNALYEFTSMKFSKDK